jgi:hypothetical protein
MKVFSKYLLLFLILGSGNLSAGVDTILRDSWLEQIKIQLPTPCEVSIIKVGNVISGNNGYRSEEWFLQTCMGNRKYLVYFYPTSAFPDRKSPYEVVWVITKT